MPKSMSNKLTEHFETMKKLYKDNTVGGMLSDFIGRLMKLFKDLMKLQKVNLQSEV